VWNEIGDGEDINFGEMSDLRVQKIRLDMQIMNQSDEG